MLLVLIDLFLTNSQHISDSGIIHLNISDHEAIFLTRKKKKEKFIMKYINARSYINYNQVDFQHRLTELDWTEFYNLDTVDELWDDFLSRVTTIADTLCPIRKIKIKDKPEQDPWVSHEILEMIQDKIGLQKLAHVSKSNDDILRAKAARIRLRQP